MLLLRQVKASHLFRLVQKTIRMDSCDFRGLAYHSFHIDLAL